jgi:ABC-type hemin transport system ATPase subunit
MISHDLNLAAMSADRLLLMKQGSVVSLGQPAEVLTF